MAEEEKKPEEKIFKIPLRKGFLKAPKWKRAKKSVKVVKEYLVKHMKMTDVRLGKELNELLWSRGAKNPPKSITVHAIVHEGIARANLTGHDIAIPKKKEKKEEKPKEEEKKGEEEKTIQRAEPKMKKSRKKPKGAKKRSIKEE